MNEKPCYTKMSPYDALNNPTDCGIERERELEILYTHNTKFSYTHRGYFQCSRVQDLFVCTILCERLAFRCCIVTAQVNGWNLMV